MSRAYANVTPGVPTDAAQLDSDGAPQSPAVDNHESKPLRESVRWYTTAKVPSGVSIINSPPQPLQVAVAEDEEQMSPVVGSNSPLRRVLWLLGYNSSEAVNIRSATRLYDAVCAQADTDGLHDTVEMIPVFYSRWLRAEGEHSRALQQELYDLFQEDVEVRVRQLTSVSVSTAVTDLEKSFYGTAYNLDMAMAGGEEPLWRVIHRNFYGEEDHKEQAAKQLTTFLLREKKCLEMTDGDALMRGRIRFTTLPPPADTSAPS